jgi:hypothetical protein
MDFEIIERPKPATLVDPVLLNTSRYGGEFGRVEIPDLMRSPKNLRGHPPASKSWLILRI